MATFGSAFNVRERRWVDFTTELSKRGGALQCDESTELYELYFVDSSEIFVCYIYKGQVPDSVQASYSQSQNDADKAVYLAQYEWLRDGASGGFTSQRTGFVSTSSTTVASARATAYSEPAAAAQRSVVSTSANDTAAGTGIRTLRITYYDGNGNGPFEETLTLNGTTPVDTVATNIRFIEKMVAETAGSNGGAVGTINLKAGTSGGGATIGSIAVNDPRTFWAHHYTGFGRRTKIQGFVAGATGNSYRVWFRIVNPLISDSARRPIGQNYRVASGASSLVVPDLGPEVADGFSLVELMVRADSATAGTVYAGFSYQEN